MTGKHKYFPVLFIITAGIMLSVIDVCMAGQIGDIILICSFTIIAVVLYFVMDKIDSFIEKNE